MNKNKNSARGIGIKALGFLLGTMIIFTGAFALGEGSIDAIAPIWQDVTRAKTLALGQGNFNKEDVFFTKIKVAFDDGRKEFEVEFIAQGTEYEYEIDSEKETVLETETEPVKKEFSNIDPSQHLGFEKAFELVLADKGYSSEKVTELTLEFDKLRIQYEVEFVVSGQKYEYTLDAISGVIIHIEIEKAEC